MQKIKKFKIKNQPTDKEFAAMPFGRQIDTLKAIETFKANSKSIHISQKRQTYTKAIKEAIALYNVTEYYCDFYCSNDCFDDTFQFWYR